METTKVFISWSGERSKAVAAFLREWLPNVIQTLEPWMSEEDIQKGKDWSGEIHDSLKNAKGCAIICVTPENVDKPWLNYEAGAISAYPSATVAVLVLGMDKSQVPRPLGGFNGTDTSQNDVYRLLESLNITNGQPVLPSTRLRRAFDLHWREFDDRMKEISSANSGSVQAKKRGTDDMLSELVEVTRRIERQLGISSSTSSLVERGRVPEDLVAEFRSLIRRAEYPELRQRLWDELRYADRYHYVLREKMESEKEAEVKPQKTDPVHPKPLFPDGVRPGTSKKN